MQERQLGDVIATFYAAATHPRQWEDAFGQLARLCSAEVAGMHLEVRQGTALTRDQVQQRWHGLDLSFQEAYRAHYLGEDLWRRKMHTLVAGTVCMGEEIVPRRELERGAFFNELSIKYGLDDLMGGILAHTYEELATMGLVGRPGRRFGAHQKQIIERALPHIARALAIGKRLLWLPDEDKRPLVDERLRITYSLTTAEARVAALIGQGLTPKEIATLHGTSWNTVRAQLGRIFAKTGARGQTKLALLVHALEHGARPSMPTGNTSPLDAAACIEEHLRARYGLTRTEARIAKHVSSGLSAKETAETLGSQWNTVRSHLRQIYRKTRSSGRAELTRLVTLLSS